MCPAGGAGSAVRVVEAGCSAGATGGFGRRNGGSSGWWRRFSLARPSAEASRSHWRRCDEPVGVAVLGRVGEIAQHVAQGGDGFGGKVVGERQAEVAVAGVHRRGPDGLGTEFVDGVLHVLGVDGAGLGDRGGRQGVVGDAVDAPRAGSPRLRRVGRSRAGSAAPGSAGRRSRAARRRLAERGVALGTGTSVSFGHVKRAIRVPGGVLRV